MQKIRCVTFVMIVVMFLASVKNWLAALVESSAIRLKSVKSLKGSLVLIVVKPATLLEIVPFQLKKEECPM